MHVYQFCAVKSEFRGHTQHDAFTRLLKGQNGEY